MSIAATCLVLLDLILGIAAAIKQKQPITSSGLKQTIIKLFVYEMALILGLIVQKYLLQDSIPLINFAATLIGCTELKSAAENLEIIYGQPFLASLITVLDNKKQNLT